MLKNISSAIYAFHANLGDEALFEGLWRIPSGVTLNSYLVKGEKTALIDCVRDAAGAPEALEAQCVEAGVSLTSIDYLVLNHLESDHTGYLRELVKRNPRVKIVATKMGINLVRNFIGIGETEAECIEVQTGSTLELGGGITLSFVVTPNVHWPETMMTYEKQSGTLFSCDAFGSYGATGERIFDNEFSGEERAAFERETLRYYSNIVASFSAAVKTALDKLNDIEVKVIAPSHGLVWRTYPETIIHRYAKYAGYNTGGAQEKEICVVWGSMYGNTRAGVDAVVAGIREAGVACPVLEVPLTDEGEVLAAAYKSRGLVIAMPTYEYKMFPPIAHILDLFGKKHFSDKIVFRMGSWGWVGGAQKDYEAATAAFKWTQLPAYEWQGVPKDADLAALTERGRDLAKQVQA